VLNAQSEYDTPASKDSEAEDKFKDVFHDVILLLSLGLGCQFKSHYSASCACELLTHGQPVGLFHGVGYVVTGQQRVGVVHVDGVLDSVPKAVVPDASTCGLVD
jgi:hypothetical protein